MTTAIIIASLALVVTIAVLVYCVRLTLVYHRFNEGIKSWAQSLDSSMRDAIIFSARNILRELDERISAHDEELNNEENIEEQ